MPGREQAIPGVTPKDVQSSISSSSIEKVQQSPLEKLVNSSLSKWGGLSERSKANTRNKVENALRDHIAVDRGQAAAGMIKWRDGISNKEGEENQGSHLRELLTFLRPEDFDAVGDTLKETDQKSKEEIVEKLTERAGEQNAPLVANFPPIVIEKVIDGFLESGFVGENAKGQLRLTARGKKANLDYHALNNMVRAYDLLNGKNSMSRSIETTSDVREIYDEHAEKNNVEKISLSVKGNSEKTLYLSKLLLGNNASDVTFLDKTLDKLADLPKEMKPDVIVVSGIMEGSHKFEQKNRRPGLVFGLDQQYKSAKVYLDKVHSLGSSVVYSMSSEDRQIAKEGALETMRNLKGHADAAKGHITYWQQNQMMQDEQFDKILQFQLDVVHPYSMLSGRRLRSADEVSELTNGEVRTEEFILLHEAYEKGLRGEEIPDEHKAVLEMDNIPFPGKEFSVKFVDDLDLKVTTKGKKRGETEDITQMIRSNLQLTDVSLPQNPLAAASSVFRQLRSEGRPTPDGLMVTGQQQVVGVGSGGGEWVMSSGSFIDAQKLLDQRGSVARAGSSPALRHVSTRRSLARPSAEMHELTNDGRHVITIFNEKLMEKSHAVPERRTVAQFTDWQNGSTTARPDLQVKFADLVASRILPDRPTYILTDGDIIHGDIYPAHKTENAHMQLVAADAQQAFVIKMLEKSFEHVSADDLKNLMKVGIVPGNHEWNNGNKDNSAVPNAYLVEFFKNLLKSKGIEPEKDQIKGYGSIMTGRGDFFKSWSGVEKDIAGHGVIFKHMLLEKGAKASGDKAPVFQAKTLFEGLSTATKDIDIGLFGHWHHPQYALFGDKLAVVGPALAGISGFEWDRGYGAVMGGTLLHLGGGLPPQIEFINSRALNEYKITKGYFSDKNLATEGFRDDRDFDPGKHGYAQRPTSTTRSALQKALWEMTYDVSWAADSEV